MIWVRVCLFAVALYILDRGSQVFACSPAPVNWIESPPRVSPSDGTKDLPLNSQFIVEYEGGYPLAHLYVSKISDIRIISANGQAIPVQIAESAGYSSYIFQFIIKPTVLLSQNTTYHIQNRMKAGRCRDPISDVCFTPGYNTISSFTTGSASDNTKPNFGGLQTIKVSKFATNDSCGSFEGFMVVLWLNDTVPNEPHTNWIRFHLYDSADLKTPIFSYIRPSRRHSYIVCTGSYSYGYETDWIRHLIYGRSYTVRAVDVAGNIDANVQQHPFLATCLPTEPLPEPVHEAPLELAQEAVTPDENIMQTEPGLPDASSSQESIPIDAGSSEPVSLVETEPTREAIAALPEYHHEVDAFAVDKRPPAEDQQQVTDSKAVVVEVRGCVCTGSEPQGATMWLYGLFVLVCVGLIKRKPYGP